MNNYLSRLVVKMIKSVCRNVHYEKMKIVFIDIESFNGFQWHIFQDI